MSPPSPGHCPSDHEPAEEGGVVELCVKDTHFDSLNMVGEVGRATRCSRWRRFSPKEPRNRRRTCPLSANHMDPRLEPLDHRSQGDDDKVLRFHIDLLPCGRHARRGVRPTVRFSSLLEKARSVTQVQTSRPALPATFEAAVPSSHIGCETVPHNPGERVKA